MLSPLIFLMWSLYFFSYLVLWLSSFHFGLTVLFFVISICTLDFLQCKECKEDIVEKETLLCLSYKSNGIFFFLKRPYWCICRLGLSLYTMSDINSLIINTVVSLLVVECDEVSKEDNIILLLRKEGFSQEC